MNKKLRREFYLLSRGEQRALLVVTFLLILSLGLRLVVQILPGREPPGVEEFERDARAIMAMLVTADSLEQLRSDSIDAMPSVYYRKTSVPMSKRAQERAFPKIDLNRADSVQLLPLPGIGPVFAGRIVKYRNLLGGFVSADQLKEVYGMPPETVEKVRDRIYIDSTTIRKIGLDSATFGELLRHPYLEYDHVKTLVEYREFKGVVCTTEELINENVLADSILMRIGPYLKYSDSHHSRSTDAVDLSK
jgi:competence ComEA-like helix-hairpin-helix protein